MKLYAQNVGFNATLNTYRAKQVIKFAKGKTCLEIGCGSGQITKYLVKYFKEVSVIDMESKHINNLPKYKNILSKQIGKFEDSHFYETYDYIVCTNIVEHIEHLDLFFKALKSVCNSRTIIFISVPNAKSYNRQLGVELGMLKDYLNLGKQDKAVGHKKMFTPSVLEFDLKLSEFKILKIGTMIYKPFPNSMMNKLPKSIINKCLNYKMKDNGAEIYVVCKIK